MNNIICQTARLILRQLVEEDFPACAAILQDIRVMYAWEHAFSDDEVQEWIAENRRRYLRDGYSYWAVIERERGRQIGLCGLLAEEAGDERLLGLGYIFNHDYWHQGYAEEAARACISYAGDVLAAAEITAQIRPENTASRQLAERLGMSIGGQFIRHYRGKEMPHLIYRMRLNPQQ